MDNLEPRLLAVVLTPVTMILTIVAGLFILVVVASLSTFLLEKLDWIRYWIFKDKLSSTTVESIVGNIVFGLLGLVILVAFATSCYSLSLDIIKYFAQPKT